MTFRALPGWVVFQAVEAEQKESELNKLITEAGAKKMSKVINSAVKGISVGDVLVIGSGQVLELDKFDMIYAIEGKNVAAIYEPKLSEKH